MWVETVCILVSSVDPQRGLGMKFYYAMEHMGTPGVYAYNLPAVWHILETPQENQTCLYLYQSTYHDCPMRCFYQVPSYMNKE